jgi:hypothetical protein
MATKRILAVQGEDLYHLAARLYGDPLAATILMRANGLSDPVLQADLTLVVPTYNSGRANDGILASQ